MLMRRLYNEHMIVQDFPCRFIVTYSYSVLPLAIVPPYKWFLIHVYNFDLSPPYPPLIHYC